MLKAVKSLLTASFVYGLGTVASKFVALFLLPVFTSYLKPEEYGLFETFNVLLLLLTTIGTLGMDSAMIRFYYDSEERGRRVLVVSSALFLAVFAGVLLSAFGFAFSTAINGVLFKGSNQVNVLHVTLLTVVVSIVNTIQLALFQTKREPGRFSVLTFIRFVATYSLSIFFLVKGDSVYGLMLSQLIAYALTLMIGFVLARGDFRPIVSGRVSKEMLRFSAPLIVGSISIWLLSSSDRFFLLRLSSLDELGLYSLGSRLASIVLFAVTAFQMAWPQFAFSQREDQNLAYTNARIFTYYLFVGILLVLCLSLFTPEILTLLANRSYGGAGSVVFLLSCSFLFYGCYFVFVIILSLTKRTLSILPVTIPPLLVSLALNYVLVPSMGGMGSAIASASSYFLMAVLTFVAAERLFHIEYEWARIVKMVAAAVPILLIGKAFSFESIFVSAGLKLLLVISYLGSLVFLRFFLPVELETIRTLARQSFQRRR